MQVKRVQDYISKEWFDETDGSYFERLNSRLQVLLDYRLVFLDEVISNANEKNEHVRETVHDVTKSLLYEDQDIQEQLDSRITFGQKVADEVARFGGSWTFILSFVAFMAIWMGLNVVQPFGIAFDKYPFILLNLALSTLAAVQAPLIMMSQNRASDYDRLQARNDYHVNTQSKEEIRLLHEKIDHLVQQDQSDLLTIQKLQTEMISGAGKTVAIQSFEDIGYFTIDNMPPSLVPKVIELVKHSEETDKIALVVDMRSRLFFDEINDILDKLESNEELNFKILFLDATDGELVSRYKETRRSHPLAADGRVLDGIKLERELLSPLKSLSQNVVDTTELTPRQLRKTISEQFSSEQDQSSFRIEVLSFGFKYGLPLDADLVFDVRFLPNPYYDPALRNLTGLDKEVFDYVMKHKESEEFYNHLIQLIKPILPGYKKEGKSVLTIAVGCTGGQHRSVAFAHRLAQDLKNDWTVNETHRDKDRRKETVNRS